MSSKAKETKSVSTLAAPGMFANDLIRHNDGKVSHTAKWKPWRIKTYVGFSDSKRAAEFEYYLKSASGRAFVKKRL